MPWGTHFCLFHKTKEDLLQTLAPYFKAGLENKEFCLWILDESLSKDEALGALREHLPKLDTYLSGGSIEIAAHDEWFFKEGTFDLHRVIDRFGEKCREVLSKGYEGLRVNGSNAWLYQENPRQHREFEQELDSLIANQRVLILCSFPLLESGVEEMLDAARTHQFTVAKREGMWEVVETTQLTQDQLEAKRQNVLPRPYPGHELLTGRERVVLDEIVRGSSSKESARILGVSTRTVEFHRANILQKFGARNTADLVRIVVGEDKDRGK